MFRVLACLTAEHDWRLVILAGIVCFVASIVAINIFHRAVTSPARTRLIWIAIAGGAIGYGIWATHFIAMLAYDPGVVVGYGMTLTALSLAAAIILTFGGFAVAATYEGWKGALVAGGILGAGIAGMHYLGMQAVEVPGRINWSLELVVASIALGMLFGFAALAVAMRQHTRRGILFAAALLTLAIVSHHFTAMGAVEIIPDPARQLNVLSLSDSVLALAIAGVALTVLGMSLVGVLADRRLASRTDGFQEIINQLSLARQQLEVSQTELEQQKIRLDTAINNMGAGLCMFDVDKRLVVCNKYYGDMYRLPPELLVPGASHRDIISHRIASGILKSDRSQIAANEKISSLAALPTDVSSSRVDELADGRLICVTRQPMPGGGWVATHVDVTEQRRSEAKITYMATHDGLTTLPNRLLLRERLDQALAVTREGGPALAVFMLDLDRFKEINDTLGHPVGDALLRAAATRLRACIPETALLARLGGDEFAIIEHLSDPAVEGTALVKRIQDELDRPFSLGDHQVTIGTSIGIAVAPRDGVDSDEILKNADLALYCAKGNDRGTFHFFEPKLQQIMHDRRKLERDIRGALDNGEFELYYQPIVDLGSGAIAGCEALLRWNHPERGLVGPAEFISLAEETGTIIPLGEWVLRTACAEAATWSAEVRIAVNISPSQFKAKDLVMTVVKALADSGLKSDRLELEITETAVLHDSEAVFTALGQLQELGVRIALDDFGTGYSSLSTLQKIPFDKIKIDRAFINDLMGDNEDARALSLAVVRFAVSLGKVVTAEGVQTQEELQVLRAEGCTEMQGFHFAEPRSAAHVRDKLHVRLSAAADAA